MTDLQFDVLAFPGSERGSTLKLTTLRDRIGVENQGQRAERVGEIGSLSPPLHQ